MPKNVYTEEFNRDAVALVGSGIPQKLVAQDLGVSRTALQTGYEIPGSTRME